MSYIADLYGDCITVSTYIAYNNCTNSMMTASITQQPLHTITALTVKQRTYKMTASITQQPLHTITALTVTLLIFMKIKSNIQHTQHAISALRIS